MERKVSAMQARRNLGRLLDEVCYLGDVFIIQRAAKPMAALVPLEQYHQWQLRREQFFALIDQAQERTRQIPDDELYESITKAADAANAISPISLQVPRLADKIVDMMQAHGVSLADLLVGLEEEREAMWRESQGNV
jgi:prevent-host-death family protein